ncbi:MAG: hypothetical protein MI924_19575 [Chloroflexales bacterium]|nr:hypothetical protein [Chloroflexales bacterium]
MKDRQEKQQCAESHPDRATPINDCSPCTPSDFWERLEVTRGEQQALLAGFDEAVRGFIARQMSRRRFLVEVARLGVGVAVVSHISTETATVRAGAPDGSLLELGPPPALTDMNLRVNGQAYALLQLDPRTSLLDALRDSLGMTSDPSQGGPIKTSCSGLVSTRSRPQAAMRQIPSRPSPTARSGRSSPRCGSMSGRDASGWPDCWTFSTQGASST